MTAQHFKTLILSLLAATTILGCTRKKEVPLEINVHHPKVQLHLDPHRMEDAYSMMILSQLYRGLLRFNSSGDVVADLAESWSESADRKSYKFKLRSATFSNGDTINARHVQMSFARIFILGAGIGADIDYIKGAKEFSKSKNIEDLGIKIISDNEVEFQLEHPSALFLKHVAVADCAIMPFLKIEDLSNPPSAFSGPYKIEDQSEGGITLKKWRKDLLESAAPPQTIHFFPTTEDAIKLAREGRTDSLDRDFVGSSDREKFESLGWGSSPTELTGETFLILNPKFLSEDLRKYLFQKIDPAEIAKKLKEPQFSAAYGLIPTGFPGELSRSDVEVLRNPTPTYSGPKKTIQFDFDPSSEVENKIAQTIKSAWTSKKITIELNPMTKAEKLDRMFSKESQVVLGRKGIDYPDGYSVLTYFKGKYDSNYFFVDDPEIDKSIGNSVGEFDSEKRTSLYRDIQVQVLKKFTVVPLIFGSQASGLWSSKIKKVPSHPMGYHTMPFETIEMRAQ